MLDGYGSSDVVVAVSDDGCQLDHPDFDSNNKFAGWGYFTIAGLVKMGDPGAQTSEMYDAGQNHGTSCAGVVAAEVDGQRTVGAAPGCKLLPIKWPSSGNRLFIGDTRLRHALDYINSRADVMSNSWGGAPVSTWNQTTLNKIDQMAVTGGRRGKGMVFLWAAGNENCPISHTTTEDVPFDSGVDTSVSPPVWVGVRTSKVFRNDLAGRAGVMHVAALASTAQRSHYSNYGTGIGICAPSSNSHEYHRLLLPGLGITTARGVDMVTDRFGGTSSATPLVAGIAALVISANPDLKGKEVIALLKETASKDLNFTGWPKTPPATFDSDTSWDISPIAPFDAGDFQERGFEEGTWSPWFGHGKVDAAAAVRQALALAGGNIRNISASHTANLAIPDRNAVGVTSSLVVADQGRIRRLRASIDITHTYRGDLFVRLVSPSGQRVVLHNRSGNSNHNLVRTYDSVSLPALSDFEGAEINGVWRLEVADLASQDVGVLNAWGIEAEVQSSDAVRIESSPGVTIPDNDPDGISDTVTVAASLVIAEIAAELDITHSYVGDLRVELAGPNGITAILKEPSAGDSSDNIGKVFTSADVPELSQFIGTQATGQWRLHVSDNAGADVGKFNRWALVLQ